MNSQIGQDKWVYETLKPKKGEQRYFVELGACDGLYYSNTLFFEKEFGWKGLCIEPNDLYYKQLLQNRSCYKSNSLISSEADVVVDFSLDNATSGIIDENTGIFTKKNNIVKKITTTLANELDKYNFPEIIDYLSLDIEGHEYEVLKSFPFDKYKFKCITVEHNEPHCGKKNRMLIRDILTKNKYIFIKGNDDVLNWGHGPIDDFYIYSFFEFTY